MIVLTFTFDGGGSDISRAITLRTSTEDNVYLGNGATGSNGNVNVVQFAASSINDGFQSFEAGEKQFRFMQLKFDITNINPNESDFTLDKIRYTISQQEKNFSTSVVYDSMHLKLLIGLLKTLEKYREFLYQL